MKFTLSWLKEHLETDAGVDAIADRLNAIGLEVEGIEDPAEKLGAFRIARVLSAAPHPQADKLQVLSVDAGDGPLQVVCGRTQCACGVGRRVRRAGRGGAVERHGAQGRGDSRRRVARDDVFVARVGVGRRT